MSEARMRFTAAMGKLEGDILALPAKGKEEMLYKQISLDALNIFGALGLAFISLAESQATIAKATELE